MKIKYKKKVMYSCSEFRVKLSTKWNVNCYFEVTSMVKPEITIT